MDLHTELYAVAKLLLSEDAPESLAEILLRRALQATEAERGFLVVRSGEGYEQRSHVRFDRESVSTDARRFSRSLVRQAIETGETLTTPGSLMYGER